MGFKEIIMDRFSNSRFNLGRVNRNSAVEKHDPNAMKAILKKSPKVLAPQGLLKPINGAEDISKVLKTIISTSQIQVPSISDQTNAFSSGDDDLDAAYCMWMTEPEDCFVKDQHELRASGSRFAELPTDSPQLNPNTIRTIQEFLISKAQKVSRFKDIHHMSISEQKNDFVRHQHELRASGNPFTQPPTGLPRLIPVSTSQEFLISKAQRTLMKAQRISRFNDTPRMSMTESENDFARDQDELSASGTHGVWQRGSGDGSNLDHSESIIEDVFLDSLFTDQHPLYSNSDYSRQEIVKANEDFEAAHRMWMTEPEDGFVRDEYKRCCFPESCTIM